MRTGTTEQLAAALAENADGNPGARLAIMGTPGDWSVCAQNTCDHPDALWLATTRRPSVMRTFRTIDAAHAAAIAIHTMADPLSERHRNVIVSMSPD
jgi:hypothetical protein